LVHDVSPDGLPEAKATLQAWQQEKSAGKVRATGLSTHSAQVASAAQAWPETEVLMLPVNAPGVCLPDLPIEGGIELMKGAAERAWLAGKGSVAMKVMGCGALAHQAEAALLHVAQLPYVHSLCIGMRHPAEIEQNAQVLGLRNCMPGASASRATKPCFS
jgi:aryl-alcohol dehydrogenase-like predicted oxidoreductase